MESSSTRIALSSAVTCALGVVDWCSVGTLACVDNVVSDASKTVQPVSRVTRRTVDHTVLVALRGGHSISVGANAGVANTFVIEEGVVPVTGTAALNAVNVAVMPSMWNSIVAFTNVAVTLICEQGVTCEAALASFSRWLSAVVGRLRYTVVTRANVRNALAIY